MGQIAVVEEGTHPAGPEENWQESVAFGWRDPVAGIAGFHRVGNEPNLGTSNMWCGVFTDDGDQFRWNLEDQSLEHIENGLVCGPQRLFHDGEALRYRLETADCRADLVVEDYGYDPNRFGSGNELDNRIFTNHFNSNCRWRGLVEIGGRAFEIDGQGWRDHSWGPRVWGSFPVNRVFLGNFGPDYELSFLTQVWTDGTLTKIGQVVRDRVAAPAEDFEFLILMEDDATSARGAEVTCVIGDESLTFRCDLVSGVICKTKQRVGFDGVGDMYDDDGRRGFCLLELNTNPRQGTELPSYVLHTGFDNGLGKRTRRLGHRPFAATMASR